MPSGNNMQEYLVKLGVNLDAQNMAKMEAFLKSSKVQAAALGGSLVALGTIIYKFAKSTTEAEYSLRNLAREQKKSVEQTRAQQNALKAMGKTADQIKKDGSLNAIYKDIVKINKEMALPNMDSVLANVTKLRGEFYSLKSTIQYALQWINYYFLNNMTEPIREVTELIKRARTWLQTNMKSIAKTISSYAVSFMKGLTGIAKTAKGIVSLFNRLPNGIKGATVAIMGFFAALKSGPVGQLLMAVEAIGGLFHDYDNYKWNKANPDKDPVEIAFPSIWEALEGEGSVTEKGQRIFDLLFGGLSESISGIIRGDKSIPQAIADLLNGPDGQGAVNKDGVFSGFGGALVAGIAAAITWETVGDKLIKPLASLLNEKDWQGLGLLSLGGFAESIGHALQTGFEKDENGNYKDWAVDLVQSVGKLFGDQDLVQTILKGAGLIDDQGNINIPDEIGKGVSLAGYGVQMVAKMFSDKAAIVDAIKKGLGLYDAIEDALEDGSVDAGESAGIQQKGVGIMADIAYALGHPLVGAFIDLFNNPEIREQIMTAFLGPLVNPSDAETNWLHGQRAGGGLKDKFLDIFLGKADSNGNRMGGMWDDIKKSFEAITQSDWFQGLGEKMRTGIVNAFDGLYALIQPKIDALFDSIKAHMPGWMKRMLNIEESTNRVENEDGTVTLASTDGSSVTASKVSSDVLGNNLKVVNGRTVIAGMEDFGEEYIRKNNNPNAAMAIQGQIQAFMKLIANAPTQNDALYLLENYANFYNRYKSGAKQREIFGAGEGTIGAFMDDYNKTGGAPSSYVPNIEIGQDGKPALRVNITANTKEADQQIKGLSQTIPVNVSINNTGTGDNGTVIEGANPQDPIATPGFSRGTRTSGPIHALIGEDGTEYVIPITKPARAVNLITQMLSEMGGSAVNAILDNLGISGSSSGTLGGSLATASSMLGGGNTNITYNNNVTAPVTITVQPGAASSQEVGSRVYSLTERYLLRTVQGVLA